MIEFVYYLVYFAGLQSNSSLWSAIVHLSVHLPSTFWLIFMFKFGNMLCILTITSLPVSFLFLEIIFEILYLWRYHFGDLNLSSCFPSQFNVRVGDQSKPEQFGSATVIVNVERNTQSPFFDLTSYSGQINFNQPLGSANIITDTNARDPDLKVYLHISYLWKCPSKSLVVTFISVICCVY